MLERIFEKLYTLFSVKLPSQIKKNFDITYTKTSKMVGSVFCLLGLLFVILSIDEFSALDGYKRWLLMATDLILPFALAGSIIYTVRFKSEKVRKIAGFIILLLMPVALMSITETLNNVSVFNMTALGFLGNYLIILMAYFIFFAITGSFKITYLIVNTVLVGLATAHSYVMDFRGTPFQPMDFLSITTAAGVANTYDYTPNYKIITAALLFVLLNVIVIKMKTPKYTLPTKLISRAFTGTFTTVVMVLFYFTSIFADMGVRPDFWNQTRGYHNYGFVLNFFTNTKYLYMNKPDDYDPDKIKDMIEQEKEDENYTKDTPNIICIMNESLADLRVLGDFETNKEYMPFMKSLKENTIRGNLYVPVIGAGTSNTEFEFLTGHTTAFLPSGSNAYMLYVKEPTASLNSTLKAQKYSSFALHPYYASGWRRTKVYSNFGFNNFISLEDIIDVSLMQEFQANGSDANFLQSLVDENYPNTNMLVRQYVSDEYNYKLLIDDFEKRNKKFPYFAFNVTMQNHGGYTTQADNFNQNIYVTSSEKEYPKVNQYLSLVKKSDTAFKKLIKYFEKVEEPTVICMFGDHQPNVEPEFISELLGVKSLSNLTTEQEQKRHITPFFIWANYDIKEKNIERISANYLSSLVLKTAGVKLTDYNEYLLNLRKTLPVINSVGYIDKEGDHYKWSDVSPYTELLSKYEQIQYNGIFDKENLKTETFFIEGYTHEATELEDKESREKQEE